MNIIKYKHHVLRDRWGDGGGSSSDNGGGNTNTGGSSRTWSDASGSVTTNPDDGSIRWTGGGGSGSFTDPNYDTPSFQNPVVVDPKIAEEQAQAAQEQRFALNKMNFDSNNPEMVQQVAQLPAINKTLGQLYSGYTTGSDFNITRPSQIASAQEAAGPNPNQGWGHSWGFRPAGTTFSQMQESETPSQQAERIGNVMNVVKTVGSGAISAMMPAPMRLALSGIQAYDNYTKNPTQGIGTALANGLSNAGGYTGVLANLYNKNYGAALSGGLTKNGITGLPNSLSSMGVDYMTGKNIAPSLGGVAGQVIGKSLGGTLGGLFGSSLGKQLSRSASIRK